MQWTTLICKSRLDMILEGDAASGIPFSYALSQSARFA
jgi:hypothetical protein